MIVYVETNFLLELAYVQERSESCQQILEFGRTRAVSLVVPTYSAAEARTTWDRRSGERKSFHDELQRQIHQLSRSQPFRLLRDSSRELTSALAFSGQDTRDRLERAIEDLFTNGTVLPLTQDIVSASRTYEHRFALTPPDALVLASVLAHAAVAGDEPKCFVSQDVKGFANPNIYDELSKYKCKVLVNFTDAIAYIRNYRGGAG